MNLQAFREELLKIADMAPPSPSKPPPMKAVAKGPAIPRPGGLKPPPLPTAAQGGDMWSAISQGMKGVSVNPMVGILKNAAPTGGSYIMPKATAAAKLMGANPHNFPKPSKVPSMSNINPWEQKHIAASANADTMTAATVPPPRRMQVQPAMATQPAPGSERMMTRAPTMVPKVAAMRDEIMKIGAGFTISKEQRESMPKGDFAVGPKKSNTGKEAYPIPDRRHAGIALGFAKMHGDTADYRAVRAKVKARYPDLLEAHDKRHEMKKTASEEIGGRVHVGDWMHERVGDGWDSIQMEKRHLQGDEAAYKPHPEGPRHFMFHPHPKGGITWKKLSGDPRSKEKRGGLSDHELELAGLGILAAPSVDEFQAHVRARVAGDKGKNAVEKRELLPSAAKPVSELAGLGTLAVPAYRAIQAHA